MQPLTRKYLNGTSPLDSVMRGNAGNWSVLVPVGKEINWDAVSKGDRKPYRANWIPVWKYREMWCGLYWTFSIWTRSELESSATQGDSPVATVCMVLECPRVPYIGNYAGMREALTSNPKYSWSPIAKSTVRERWKEPLLGNEKSLKPVSNRVIRH